MYNFYILIICVITALDFIVSGILCYFSFATDYCIKKEIKELELIDIVLVVIAFVVAVFFFLFSFSVLYEQLTYIKKNTSYIDTYKQKVDDEYGSGNLNKKLPPASEKEPTFS